MHLDFIDAVVLIGDPNSTVPSISRVESCIFTFECLRHQRLHACCRPHLSLPARAQAFCRQSMKVMAALW